MKLPTLYQKTQTGAIQQWTISTYFEVDVPGLPGVIVVEHGQVGGKLQIAADTVREGKNPGKKNATTPIEQAEKEAAARWTKQKKKGYVESLADAEAGKVDETLILGGIEPMLAPNKSYPKDKDLEKAIVFPAFFQPKLDGQRCIAIIEDGVCTLWTRTRKPIPTVPHIVEALAKAFPTGKVILDGELYNHDYKDRFEDLMSILRGAAPDDEGEYLNAQYHVYDCPEQDVLPWAHNMLNEFVQRNVFLDKLFEQVFDTTYIKRVVTTEVASMAELLACYEQALAAGYEGGMARNADGEYEAGKRSKHLQKMKEFIEAEFPIEGVMDGRGKAANIVIKFIVRLANGLLAYPTYKATQAKRRDMFTKPEMWTGKKLTVVFKRFTADGNLYIPTAKTIRDYE